MSNVQPGWFPDPSDATRLRWWDGGRWTEHTAAGAVTNPAQPTVPAPRARRRIPVWGWVFVGVPALFATILLAPLVAVIALTVLITAIVGLSRGSRTWLRLSSRKAAVGVVAGASLVLLLSGAVSAAMTSRVSTEPAVAEAQRFAGAVPSSEPAAATPSPTPTPKTTTREEVVTEVIPFERTTIEDAATPRGQNSVTTNGQDGERSLTYRVTLVDGVETGRELIFDVVTRPAVAEVTTVGTYDAPPPPAPVASDCNSNYADACVPNASDVDCAWGSGNGPAYFDGVARVVGTDVYDLDRDKDGLACEQ